MIYLYSELVDLILIVLFSSEPELLILCLFNIVRNALNHLKKASLHNLISYLIILSVISDKEGESKDLITRKLL